MQLSTALGILQAAVQQGLPWVNDLCQLPVLQQMDDAEAVEGLQQAALCFSSRLPASSLIASQRQAASNVVAAVGAILRLPAAAFLEVEWVEEQLQAATLSCLDNGIAGHLCD